MGEEREKPFAKLSKGEMPQGYWKAGIDCRIYSGVVITGMPVRSNQTELLPKQP